jgi:hypothetical protein
MKHLLTISALLISSLAMGQWPSLPYNPDDNADGLIGVADLQALLANYGSEFASAVVSEDGESALVFVGSYSYPSCAENCSALPGHWRIASLEEIGPVFEDIVYSPSPEVLWLRTEESHPWAGVHSGGTNASNGNFTLEQFPAVWSAKSCYCAAKQLPRVEYSQCSNCVGNMYGTPSAASIAVCCNQKVAEGWYPLGGTSPSGASYPCISQSFWRWAE